MWVIFNSQVSPNSMGGGDKITLSICSRLLSGGRYDISFAGCPEGLTMAKKWLPSVRHVPMHNFTAQKDGFFGAYFWRCLWAPAIFTLPIEADSVIWSFTDFLPDVLPGFIYKLVKPGTKWFGSFFLRARNPFIGEIGFSLSTVFFFLLQLSTVLFYRMGADKVFVLCDDDAMYLARLGVPTDRIVKLSGGVDVEAVNSVQVPADRIYDACYIGRFHYQKGIDDLLFVVEKLKETVGFIKVAVVGWGNEGEEAKLRDTIKTRGLEDAIEYLGFLDGVQKYQVIKASKMLLFPSKFESWGVVVAEGIACHTPVVAYDLPVLKEQFTQGVSYVPSFDKEAFFAEAVKILSDWQYRQSLSASDEFISGLSWEIAARVFDKAVTGEESVYEKKEKIY